MVTLPMLVVAGRAQAQKRLQIPSKWYVVQANDNAFTVEMPEVPDHRLINDVSARGTPFVLHSYSLDYGGNSYVAQTALYPADVDARQPRTVLQAALNARAQGLGGGKWSTTNWREIEGATAVESTGALANGSQLRQLSVLKGQRFISLAFLGPNVTGPDADRFFHSLKFK
ncbi:MAG: hypothetical protein JSS04_05590 [Proteobacteria bacterium]|nr:hypothetical protein [Pseudomonadota bacterium]